MRQFLIFKKSIEARINLKTENFTSLLPSWMEERVNKYDPTRKHTSGPQFKKVECYEVAKEKSKVTAYKMETENPKMVSLTQRQQFVLENWVNKALNEHRRGTSPLSEESLLKYNSVLQAIKKDIQISKSCVDFLLADMENNKGDSYPDIAWEDELDRQFESTQNSGYNKPSSPNKK